MIKLTIFLISLFTITAAANDECINKYRKNFFKKNAKYEKSNERYKRQASRWLDRQRAFASFGAKLNNDPYPTSPKKEDFKLYEDGIIKSYEMDLTVSLGSKPEFFNSLYKEAKKIDDNVTPQLVQDQLKVLMNDGEFCKTVFFGLFENLSKAKEAKEMVLESLKTNLIALSEDANVNDEVADKGDRLDSQSRTVGSSSDSNSSLGNQ
jgi:hypothetical protein